MKTREKIGILFTAIVMAGIAYIFATLIFQAIRGSIREPDNNSEKTMGSDSTFDPHEPMMDSEGLHHPPVSARMQLKLMDVRPHGHNIYYFPFGGGECDEVVSAWLNMAEHTNMEVATWTADNGDGGRHVVFREKR